MKERHSASSYQTTNYGLSGLVTTHSDSWGYFNGVELPSDRANYIDSGDVVATFMAWLNDVPAGNRFFFF